MTVLYPPTVRAPKILPSDFNPTLGLRPRVGLKSSGRIFGALTVGGYRIGTILHGREGLKPSLHGNERDLKLMPKI